MGAPGRRQVLGRLHAWLTCPCSLQAHPPAAQRMPQAPTSPRKHLAKRPTCTGSQRWSPVRSTPVQRPPRDRPAGVSVWPCAWTPSASSKQSGCFSFFFGSCHLLPPHPPSRAHRPPSWALARGARPRRGRRGGCRPSAEPAVSARPRPPRRLPPPRTLRALQSPPTQRPELPAEAGTKH